MITKEMTIEEILQSKENAAEILMRNGMGCVGCPSSRMETLEEACVVHGMDSRKVFEELNA